LMVFRIYQRDEDNSTNDIAQEYYTIMNDYPNEVRIFHQYIISYLKIHPIYILEFLFL